MVDSKEMVWALVPEAGSGKLLYALVPAPLLRVVSPILRGMLSLLAVVDFKETDLQWQQGLRLVEQGRKAWRHASQRYGSREHSNEPRLPARPEPEEGRPEGAEGTGPFSRADCLLLRAQGPPKDPVPTQCLL